MFALLATITVIRRGCVLKTAAAFNACILSDLRYLIANVVGINFSRVHTSIFPNKQFSFNDAAKNICVQHLLTPVRDSAVNRALVSQCNDFTARATATRVRSCFRCAILVCGNEWAAFPVVCLLNVNPACRRVVTSRYPLRWVAAGVRLGRVRGLDRA